MKYSYLVFDDLNKDNIITEVDGFENINYKQKVKLAWREIKELFEDCYQPNDYNDAIESYNNKHGDKDNMAIYMTFAVIYRISDDLDKNTIVWGIRED